MIFTKLFLFTKRSRILIFLLPLFFFYFNENIISLIYPIIAEDIVKSSLIVGIIISFSSLVGVICDFVLPQILSASNWKQQFAIGIILSILLNAVLNLSIRTNSISLLILSAVLWTIYFELCSFSIDNFITVEGKESEYVYEWSLISLIYTITGIIGPILGSIFIKDFFLLLLILEILSLSTLVLVGALLPVKKDHKPKSRIKSTITFFKELHIWEVLIPKVLPLLLFTISIGMIGSMYWTIGGLYATEIFSEELSFIPIISYSIPFLLGALIMAKMNIRRYKKRISQILLCLGSIILLIFLFPSIEPIFAIILILISSFFISLAEPLNDGSFSDLLVRLGKDSEHLIGIKKVGYSISYFIGPLLSGIISSFFGYHTAIGVMGIFTLIIGIILLLITPKKIKIPETSLKRY